MAAAPPPRDVPPWPHIPGVSAPSEGVLAAGRPSGTDAERSGAASTEPAGPPASGAASGTWAPPGTPHQLPVCPVTGEGSHLFLGIRKPVHFSLPPFVPHSRPGHGQSRVQPGRGPCGLQLELRESPRQGLLLWGPRAPVHSAAPPVLSQSGVSWSSLSPALQRAATEHHLHTSYA